MIPQNPGADQFQGKALEHTIGEGFARFMLFLVSLFVTNAKSQISDRLFSATTRN